MKILSKFSQSIIMQPKIQSQDSDMLMWALDFLNYYQNQLIQYKLKQIQLEAICDLNQQIKSINQAEVQQEIEEIQQNQFLIQLKNAEQLTKNHQIYLQKKIVSNTEKLQKINQKMEEIILYQTQFDFLVNYICQLILEIIFIKPTQIISSEKKNQFSNLNQLIIQQFSYQKQKHQKFTKIIIVGDHQSGKKHLINQVLHKVRKNFNQNKKQALPDIKEPLHLLIEKIFFNKRIIDSHPELLNILEQQYQFQNFYSLNQLKGQTKVFQLANKCQPNKLYIFMRAIITCNILLPSVQTKISTKDNNFFCLDLLIYCLNHHQFQDLSINDLSQFIVIKLPDLYKSQKISYQTVKSQLMTKLKYLFSSQLEIIAQKLNKLLFRNKIYCQIKCSDSVKSFIVKYFIQKYQIYYHHHPLICIKYLSNYINNYYKKHLNMILSSSNYQMLDQNFSFKNQLFTFDLQSTVAIQFFEAFLSPNYSSQSLISSLNFSSFILGHQIVLLSCYLYLTSEFYLNALFIDAIKLYPFFLSIVQSLKIDFMSQQAYWIFLEKLKEMAVIQLIKDQTGWKKSLKKSKQSSSGNKQQRAEKRLKSIKQQNFFSLKCSLQKIKDELKEIKIYHKFFLN